MNRPVQFLQSVTIDNRQDVAVSWDSCTVGFQIPGDWTNIPNPNIEEYLLSVQWPRHWRCSRFEVKAVAGFRDQVLDVVFHVSAPPRAADGATVRAILNMIPKRVIHV